MRYLRQPTRREFLKGSGAALAAFYAGYAGRWSWPAGALAAATPDVVVAQQGSPTELVKAAVDALGGMGRFVQPGQFVVIKPNFTWGSVPERANDTNPEVVNAVVALCKAAGAKRVLVVDHVLNGNLTACLETTGMRKAVESAGGEILGLPPYGQENRYGELAVPKGQNLKKAYVIKELLEADVLINVPIAKDHSGSRLTLSLKNLMGVVLDRDAFHSALDQCIADVNTAIKSNLILLDAVRILTTNGPSGMGKVESPGKIIAGLNPVAVDGYAATLFKLTGADIAHIRRAKAAGLGEYDLSKLAVQTVTPQTAPAPQPAPTASPSPMATPTRPAATPTAVAARPTLQATATLRPYPTPTLAASSGGLDPIQVAPYVGVPVVALLAFVGWAVRRRMGGGRGEAGN